MIHYHSEFQYVGGEVGRWGGGTYRNVLDAFHSFNKELSKMFMVNRILQSGERFIVRVCDSADCEVTE